jgi:hypothetical protein
MNLCYFLREILCNGFAKQLHAPFKAKVDNFILSIRQLMWITVCMRSLLLEHAHSLDILKNQCSAETDIWACW